MARTAAAPNKRVPSKSHTGRNVLKRPKKCETQQNTKSCAAHQDCGTRFLTKFPRPHFPTDQNICSGVKWIARALIPLFPRPHCKLDQTVGRQAWIARALDSRGRRTTRHSRNVRHLKQGLFLPISETTNTTTTSFKVHTPVVTHAGIYRSPCTRPKQHQVHTAHAQNMNSNELLTNGARKYKSTMQSTFVRVHPEIQMVLSVLGRTESTQKAARWHVLT